MTDVPLLPGEASLRLLSLSTLAQIIQVFKKIKLCQCFISITFAWLFFIVLLPWVSFIRDQTSCLSELIHTPYHPLFFLCWELDLFLLIYLSLALTFRIVLIMPLIILCHDKIFPIYFINNKKNDLFNFLLLFIIVNFMCFWLFFKPFLQLVLNKWNVHFTHTGIPEWAVGLNDTYRFVNTAAACQCHDADKSLHPVSLSNHWPFNLHYWPLVSLSEF